MQRIVIYLGAALVLLALSVIAAAAPGDSSDLSLIGRHADGVCNCAF